MAVKEEPEPVTFAFGVPEPHCAAAVERNVNTATKIDSLAIFADGLGKGKQQFAAHRVEVCKQRYIVAVAFATSLSLSQLGLMRSLYCKQRYFFRLVFHGRLARR